jgi:hypothetical protein
VSTVEPRILAAWREWLAALAKDPDSAIAAAHVYGSLTAEGRDAWLTAVEEDGPKLGVPIVALYAPLLSVETDASRIERISQAIIGAATPHSTKRTVALRGVSFDSMRVAALIAPLYADFVQVLWCRYSPHRGFDWVRLDPILREEDAPKDRDSLEGVALEATPLKLVVEELALAILAQRRLGQEIPRSMVGFANLFDANPDADASSS